MGSCYPHLTFEERRKIAKWRDAKMPVPEIADRLGRAPSTIYRELRRNLFEDKEMPELNGYHALVAHLPRTTDPTILTPKRLRTICRKLNSTPRKCLGYRTPAEVFESRMLEIRNRVE